MCVYNAVTMRLLCITRQANLSHSAVACSTISCLSSWQTSVPKLLHHPNLNSSAYLQVTEREITLMWILLWQNWCSRLLRARNVMKQRHDMEWHSHKRMTQSLYRVFLGGPRLGGYQKRFMSSAGGRSEKLVHYLLFPFLLCLGFVFTTLHFTTRSLGISEFSN